MHPKQIALLEGALDAVAAECLRSPVATLNAGHLKAFLVEHFLRAGAGVLERGASGAEGKVLRLAGEVVRVERVPIERKGGANGGRPPRAADLRLCEPIALALDVYARSALASPDRLAPRALLDRLGALEAGSADALILACDRRLWDGMRVERAAEGEEPAELSRLCAALLPPSGNLTDERTRTTPAVNRRPYTVIAAITPMVFGAQRVVAAVWRPQKSAGTAAAAAQLDAFA